MGDIENLKVCPILHWTNYYISDLAGDISKKVRDISKKISTPISKVTIITTHGLTDSYEQLVDQIIQNGKPVDKNEIIKSGTQINPIMLKDNKSVGLLIKHYRRVCDLIEQYGESWYQMMVRGDINEKDVLTQYLKYHLKINPSDKYTIDIISFPIQNEEYADKYKKINGIKLNEPMIHCE